MSAAIILQTDRKAPRFNPPACASPLSTLLRPHTHRLAAHMLVDSLAPCAAFLDELRAYAMKLHTREQAPREGKAEAPKPAQAVSVGCHPSNSSAGLRFVDMQHCNRRSTCILRPTSKSQQRCLPQTLPGLRVTLSFITSPCLSLYVVVLCSGPPPRRATCASWSSRARCTPPSRTS